ncbi:MAG: hypothetical protein J7L89_05120 [Bacteroidales bacterium]|nr:hypothetical protein [Bacteroidales bacterium]
MNYQRRIFGIFLLLAVTACQKEIGFDPYIEMNHFSDCKNSPLKTHGDYSSSQDCLTYQYDGDSTLQINHINSGFNCCPGIISVAFEQRGDTLLINESERQSICDCDCLYDLNYTIHGLPPGSYVIFVQEPYVQPDCKKMMVPVDLKEQPIGEFCIERTFYPWGI